MTAPSLQWFKSGISAFMAIAAGFAMIGCRSPQPPMKLTPNVGYDALPLNQNGSSKATQLIPITSAPDGATITCNGAVVGVTPMKVEVPRDRQDNQITISLAGYRTETIDLVRFPNDVGDNQAIAGVIGVVASVVQSAGQDPWKQIPWRMDIRLVSSNQP